MMEKPNTDRHKRNALGFYTKPQGWNNLTRMCYLRGCNCRGCEYSDFFSQRDMVCQTKAAVLESVKLFGIPFERDISEVVIGE